MSNAAKDDALTRFLMYKIAIRNGEVDLAAESLERVYQSSNQDPNLLYACVLDAQQAGDKKMATEALQLILQKHGYNAPPSIHMPALLRCTIRLLISERDTLDSQKNVEDKRKTAEQLCKLFEGGELYPSRYLSFH
jgi:hypothetical protein